MTRRPLALVLIGALALLPGTLRAQDESPAAEAPPAQPAGEESPAAEAPAAEAPAASEAPAEPPEAAGDGPNGEPASPSPQAQAPAPAPASPAAEPLPSDVPEKHWAAGAVRRMLRRKMMELHGGKFAGTATATRRDLAMVLGGVLVATGKGKAEAPRDVPANDPAAKQIALAAGSGAIKLRGGKLHGNQHITREDLAHSFSRLIAVVEGTKEGPVPNPVDLNDLPPDSPLFLPVQRVLRAKIISLMAGKYEGYLPVPRFQLAAVAVKSLDLFKAK